MSWDPRPIFGTEQNAPVEPEDDEKPPEPQPLGPEGDGEPVVDTAGLLDEIHKGKK